MLKVHAMALGAYQTNCYILHDESSKTCCVVDPGYEADTILDKLDALGLTVEAILLTHGHFDHVGAVRELAAETGCDVYIHPDDLSMPPMMTAGPLYYTKTYTEGTRRSGHRRPAYARPHPRFRLPADWGHSALRRYAVCRLLRPHRSSRR